MTPSETKTPTPRISRALGALAAALAAVFLGGGSALAAHTPDHGDPATAQDAAAASATSDMPMLAMPMMNPTRGRKLFAAKGCVVCHSINGVGGEDAPPLDFTMANRFMNPFDFTARMWRGAEAMIAMQREELGDQIEFSGQELADIIAFAHDPAEQKRFSEADIPSAVKKLMSRMDAE